MILALWTYRCCVRLWAPFYFAINRTNQVFQQTSGRLYFRLVSPLPKRMANSLLCTKQSALFARTHSIRAHIPTTHRFTYHTPKTALYTFTCVCVCTCVLPASMQYKHKCVRISRCLFCVAVGYTFQYSPVRQPYTHAHRRRLVHVCVLDIFATKTKWRLFVDSFDQSNVCIVTHARQLYRRSWLPQVLHGCHIENRAALLLYVHAFRLG